MRSARPWAVAALLWLAPAAAQAQNPCAENLKWPAVGRWAEYNPELGAAARTARAMQDRAG